jgi:hypothetical protein
MSELIVAKGKLDQDTISKYVQLEKAFIEALREIQQILLALGHTTTKSKLLKSVPLIDDIKAFLRDYGKPAHQCEIIRAVGELRKKRHPDLVRPYMDVWKSLVYHDKHDEEIGAVEIAKDGVRRAKLKERKARRYSGQDAPEHYREPDNIFWFLSELKSRR